MSEHSSQPNPDRPTEGGSSKSKAPIARGILIVGAMTAATVTLAIWLGKPEEQPKKPSEPPPKVPAEIPVPPLTSSPFLNTSAAAHYVGSASCTPGGC